MPFKWQKNYNKLDHILVIRSYQQSGLTSHHVGIVMWPTLSVSSLQFPMSIEFALQNFGRNGIWSVFFDYRSNTTHLTFPTHQRGRGARRRRRTLKNRLLITKTKGNTQSRSSPYAEFASCVGAEIPEGPPWCFNLNFVFEFGQRMIIYAVRCQSLYVKICQIM